MIKKYQLVIDDEPCGSYPTKAKAYAEAEEICKAKTIPPKVEIYEYNLHTNGNRWCVLL